MRADGAGRVPRATPPVGSGTNRPVRAPRITAPTPSRHRSVDGRLARGLRSRTLLVEALVAMVDDGATAPTTRQVAERAGVSVRLVFHHFHTIQGLLVAAATLQAERHRHVLFDVPPRGPPALRIRALCRQRRLYFEALAPVHRVAGAGVSGETDLADLLAQDRIRLRSQLAGTLAPEVAGRGAEADVLLDALEQATGWEAWRALRDVRGKTPAAAELAMAFTAVRLLS